MPYIVTFLKPFVTRDPGQYINDCCIGGDVVLDQLLPALAERYGNLQSNQEDWGWFAWFEDGGARLAVDVYTEDPSIGLFQLHLTSRTPRFLLGSKVQDGPELEALRELVISRLNAWPVGKLDEQRVDKNYMPS